MDKELVRRLGRQSLWLRDSLLWLLDSKIVDADGAHEDVNNALDVGCGPGFTMKILAARLEVSGVDSDIEMVGTCQSAGLHATIAEAENLPFEDASFDLVYCSFLLLWVKNPLAVIKEMKRVSRRWVVCFAEPDYGARLDYPPEMSSLAKLVADDLVRDGGDPFIGRRLRSLFSEAGMTAELGVHMGIWGLDKLRDESEEELRWLEGRVFAGGTNGELRRSRKARDDALRAGSLFQFNPILYAIARKDR